MTAKPRGITIAGNWKMNHGLDATSQFFEGLKSGWNDLSEDIKSRLSTNEIKVICFPPFLSLGKALEASSNISLSIGAQNAHWEESGAFTGEVSGPMLKEFGINHVLVGHSERRQFFGETNESARERTIGLLKQGFQVMLCVGETKEEREANRTEEVVLGQLKAAIKESDFLNGQLTIAYEPVWAIGTGLTATPEQAEAVHHLIRKHLWDCFSMEAAGKTSILYGGSVKAENISQLLACPNIDGGLVGGASLKPESFLKLFV